MRDFYMLDTVLLPSQQYQSTSDAGIGELTQKGYPVPLWSLSGCRKGEAWCVSTGWHL